MPEHTINPNDDPTSRNDDTSKKGNRRIAEARLERMWLLDFSGVLNHPDVLRADQIRPEDVDIDPATEARMRARFALIGERLEQIFHPDEPDRELTREEVFEISGGDDPVGEFEARQRRARMHLVSPPGDEPEERRSDPDPVAG